MMITYYHATTEDNFMSILDSDYIKAGCDGGVYLTINPKDAAKFVAIRGIKDIFVFELALDESNVVESFDHCESFFQCRAYYHRGDISTDCIQDVMKYSLE